MKTVLRLLPLLLVILTGLLSGCSHTYPVTFRTDKVRGDTVTAGTLNRRLASKEVTIFTRDGRARPVSRVFLTPDSCLFSDTTGRAFLRTADVLKVRHVDYLSSSVGGFCLGFLGGVALATGATFLLLDLHDADSRPPSTRGALETRKLCTRYFHPFGSFRSYSSSD